MKNEGKRFEESFKKSVPKDVYYLRMIDPAIGFDITTSTQRFAPKNPYDLVLYKRPEMMCIELKSTKGKSFSFDGASPSIAPHQIKALTEASKYCKAGFVFNLRTSECTYYVSIEKFNELIKKLNKVSLNENEIKEIGMIIPSKKLRVNYKYDLSALFI